MKEACNLYEAWTTVLLECSMTHLPDRLRAGILLSPENLVRSISDTVRWWRLAGFDFSRPLSLPLLHHCPHPHFIPLSVIDGNVLPGLAPCHGVQPGARTAVRGSGGEEGGRGFELYRCHRKSVWSEFTPTQYIRAKPSPLTTQRCASRGYNSSGALGQTAHLHQVNRVVKETVRICKVHTEFAFKAKWQLQL